MKKYVHVLCGVLFLFLLAACSKEDNAILLPGEDQPVATRAADRPFKGGVTAVDVDSYIENGQLIVVQEGTGHFTHLGQTGYVNHLNVAQNAGSSVFTAANGDQLFVSAAGELVDVYPDGDLWIVIVEGDFIITGGTDRFEDATGGGFIRITGYFPNLPPEPGDLIVTEPEYDGVINY